MRRLLSSMVDLKDHVKIDSLRFSVLESMKAILEASQYIRDYLEDNKFGEDDYEACRHSDSEGSGCQEDYYHPSFRQGSKSSISHSVG